jgi:hypothetical protein
MSEALEQVTQPITRDEPRDLAAMDGLDLLLLLALLPLHWALFFLVVFQWFVRRNPRLLAGLLRYVGGESVLHHPGAVEYLPGLRQVPAPAPTNGTTSKPATQHPTSAPDQSELLHTLLATPPHPPPATQPDAAAAATAPAPVLPWKQWRLQAVQAHHLLIIGNTDSGKTTLVRALLTGKRGTILIIDPKNRPGKWGDITALGLDDDAEYTRIDQALQMVLAELRQRQKALNHGSTTFPSLTVVVDEAPDVADECMAFPTLFKRVGSVGRELHISLIVLSQRSTVRPLGIEGDGQARDNFTKILMGSFARRMEPALAGQRYCAILDSDGDQHILDVSPLPIYARLPVREDVPWDDTHAGNAHLASCETGFTGEDKLLGQTGSETSSEPGSGGFSPFDAVSEEAVLVTLMQRGVSQNLLCQVIGGNKVTAIEQIKALARRYGFEKYA